MPKILLLATGGTIASTTTEPEGPVVASLAGEALLAGVSLPEGVELHLRSFPPKDSSALTPADIQSFAEAIAQSMAEYDGFVLTHGTDTMEDTAFGLELLLAPEKPVVMTGSMRHAGEPDSDGPRNLRDAIRAAATPSLGAAGVVVVFEGDIHAAWRVRKAHTSRVDAFRSGDFGKIGAVEEGRVALNALPCRRAALGLSQTPRKVLLLSAAMGMEADLLLAAAGLDYEAAVLIGFGRGNFPDGWAEGVKDLLGAGKPVVVASRCSEGGVAPIYGGDSGGATLAALGVRFGGSLAPSKLRLLLAYGLATDRGNLDDLLATYAV